MSIVDGSHGGPAGAGRAPGSLADMEWESVMCEYTGEGAGERRTNTGQCLPRRELGEKTSQLILRVTPGLEPEPGSRKGAVRPAKCPEA